MLIGIAPLTLVRTTAGRTEYVYAGAPAPEGILPEDAVRLVAEGFLLEVEDAVVEDEDVVVPDDPGTGNLGPGVTVEAPPKAARKDLWIDYRATQYPDVPRSYFEADEVTKEQLQDDAFVLALRPQA